MGNAFWLAIVGGVGVGGIYVLVGLSYNVILASCGLFNFAQGTVVTLGSVAAYTLAVAVHLPVLQTVSAVLFAGVVVGCLTYRVAARPFLRRLGNVTDEALLATLGLGLAFGALIQIAFGQDQKPVPGYIPTETLHIASVPINTMYILMVG